MTCNLFIEAYEGVVTWKLAKALRLKSLTKPANRETTLLVGVTHGQG